MKIADARQPFALLLDLLAAIDDGRPPRPEVREWFLTSCDAWARSASTKPLHEHLGLSRRLRRDYLQARLHDALEDALRAFVEARQGSAWDLSAAFVAELKRFEQHADRDPGSSRLSRALWRAFRVGLPVPTSREYWFSKLKSICIDGSVNIPDDGVMYPELYETFRARALAAWKQSADLQATCSEEDFMRASYRDVSHVYSQHFAYPRCDTQAGTTAVMQWLNDRFSSGAIAPHSPEEKSMTTPAPNRREDSTDVEAQARREWQRDPDLRADFGDNTEGFESYCAYKRAMAAGLVKTFGTRK